MREVKLRPYAVAILELFEDLLDEHNIDIPDESREGEEGEARIYGATYYDLEDAVVDLLHKFASEVDKECRVELVDSF